MYTSPNEWIWVGNQVITNLASATALTIPNTRVDSARLRISGQSVYASFDGGNADTNDAIWDTGTYWLDNERTMLVKASFLQSGASARIDIDYFSQRG